MLIEGQLVQLNKVSAENTPRGMLPVAYWLRGMLAETPTIGHTLRVWRTERAAQSPGEVEPVKLAGVYTSSPIRAMVEHDDGSVTVETANSHWRITPIEAKAP